jgi:hypothetical protein
MKNKSVSGRFSPDKIDGFRYWDQTVNGAVSGTVPVNSRQAAVELTAGVDLVGGQLRYWVAPQSGVSVKGLAGNATVGGTVNIGELKGVKVSGKFDVGLNAAVKLRDLNGDGRVRVDELQDRRGATGDIDGKLTFAPTFQAKVAGTVPFTFTGQFDNTVRNSESQLAARLTAGSYEQFGRDVAVAFLDGRPKIDLFAGLDSVLNKKVPLLGKTVGELLGDSKKVSTALAAINPGVTRTMPFDQVLTRLTAAGIKFGLNRADAPAALDKLMKGERVDLISQRVKVSKSLTELLGLKDLKWEQKVAAYELGLAGGSVSLYLEPGLSVKAEGGFGMDTRGVYLDADTGVTLNGSISAGAKGEVHVLGVIPLASVKGGLKVDVNLTARVKDPSPGDGRAHLSELNGQPVSRLLGTNLTVDLKGEIEAKIGGKIDLGFWKPDLSIKVWGREWNLYRFVDYSSDGQRPVSPGTTKDFKLDHSTLPREATTQPKPAQPPKPVTPPAQPPKPPAPAQPLTRVQNLRSGSATRSSFVVQWNDGQGETRYEVMYSSDNGRTFQKENVPANATRATITGLKANVSYVVKVVSVSGTQRVESNAIRVRTA